MTGVETVKVQDLAGAAVNLANATGVTKLVAANSTAQTTFNNVDAIADVEVNGGAGMTVAYDAAVVAGLTDAQNVAVNGATGTVNVAGVETFNVAATGANTLTLANDGDTVNVSGEGSVAFGGTLNVTTLDASANTGGVTATIGAGNVAVTGGAGNDTFSFGAGLTAAATGVPGDVVDGGEGTDTVRVTTSGNLQTAASAAPFNSLTSVERVAFDGNGVQLNGSTFNNAAITNIEFNTTGADIINNAGSARMYEFGDANTGSATFNMSGTNTTLNLVMLGTEGTAAANDGADADVGTVVVNLAATAPAGTLATINIDSQGDLADDGAAGNTNEVGAITAVAGSTINISGAGNLDLDGLANRGIIDASTATGNLVLEGSDFVQFVAANPGATPPVAGVDFVSGADTITLGAGSDTIQFGSGLASGVANSDTAATNTNTDLQVDVVNSFTAGLGGDVLDFTGGAAGDSDYTALVASAQTAIDALSGAGATLQAAANIATNAIVQDGVFAGEWSAFTFQGQSYAVYDATTGGNFDDANDLLVQITGVNVADLTDANFA